MKQSIRFVAMLFACFAINFFFSSCNRGAKFNGKTGQKLIGPINITGYNISDQSLTLKDVDNNNARYVSVSRTQVINWNVTSEASEVEIVEIAPDPGYHYNDPSFFSTVPHEVGASSHWQATIGSPDPNNGIIFEKYYIKWKLKNDSKTYSFDPLLQLNP